MALLELSMVTGAIVEMGIEGVWTAVKHREAVIKVLTKLGLPLDQPPPDFAGVYSFTLVEYGIGKPEKLLNLFRHSFIQDAFQQSFIKRDPSILNDEAENLIQWHTIGNELHKLRIEPRREFAHFTIIFNEIIDRTRTPVEVRQDHAFEDIHTHLAEITQMLGKLKELAEIRLEHSRIQRDHQARRFSDLATQNSLKVFLTSETTEFHDIRELIRGSLDSRGVFASVYKADLPLTTTLTIKSSFSEIHASDIVLYLCGQKYSQESDEEYRYARDLKKPCFVCIWDKGIQREDKLTTFLNQEVLDPRKAASYWYFESSSELSEQAADYIMAWLVRRHREMTAEIQEARISGDELARRMVEVERLQSASRSPLPQGTPIDLLAQQMRTWFGTLGYHFEIHQKQEPQHFEWVINVPSRRAFERVLVRGISGEVQVPDVLSLQHAVDEQKVDEGWLVAQRRVSQAARAFVNNKGHGKLFCYTFDELMDEHIDLENYFEWLETEVKRRNINTMYTPLACSKTEFDPVSKQPIDESRYDENNGWIDRYVDLWLADPSKEHISILGEFGTGKTWFALHYAWIALQRYRTAREQGVERPRIPIVIPLRDYAKSVSVESLFSEFFFRKHGVSIPSYAAFDQLNRMGKLLLIFDGFDEMAAKIDRQKMINNFWELAKVVVPGSKAILTCRTEHFPEAREGRALLNAELQASTSNLSGEAPQFEVLELQKLDDSQISQILSSRTTPDIVARIISHPQLIDLARRPVMIELILDALPDIEDGKPIDVSRIYLYAIRRKMDRDIREERTFTSLADKLFFLCELSWQMFVTSEMTINYRDFPKRLRSLFGRAVETQKDLDHWHFDMMGQTMLIRNSDGDYLPAHRTLVEFFVAYKMAAELGVLASDFTELAKSQSYIDNSLDPCELTWSAYFQRKYSDNGEVKFSVPLQRFAVEPLTRLKETVGHLPFRGVILDLLASMISKEDSVTQRLFGVIKETQNRKMEEVKYVGGNSATLLSRVNSMGLEGKDMNRAVLTSAYFSYASLKNSTMFGVDLQNSIFRNTDLSNCNLQNANLCSAQFQGVVLVNADARNADLTDVSFDEMGPVRSVAVHPSGKYLAAASSLGLKLWDLHSGELIQSVTLPHRSYLRDVQFSPAGDSLASTSVDGTLAVWNMDTFDLMFSMNFGSEEVHRVAYSPDGNLVSTGCEFDSIAIVNLRNMKITRISPAHNDAVSALSFTPDGKTLISGSYDSSIRGWSVDNGKALWIIKDDFGTAVNSIVFSPDQQSFAVGSHAANVRIYDRVTREIKFRLHGYRTVWSVAYQPSGFLIAATQGNNILVWNVNDKSLIFTIDQAHQSAIRRLVFSPDSSLLISCSLDGTVRLWDMRLFVSLDNEPYLQPNRNKIPARVSDNDENIQTKWWEQGKYTVPEGMRPNTNICSLINVLAQRIDCTGLRLAGAKGLKVSAPDNIGNLHKWLEDRGASFTAKM